MEEDLREALHGDAAAVSHEPGVPGSLCALAATRDHSAVTHGRDP